MVEPGIVIIDSREKKVHIFELTGPLAMNIDQRHQEKSHNYAPFLTDMTGYDCSVNCFEVSSTGFITKRNKSTLTTLHSFIKPDIKKSAFLKNLHSLAWYGSYKLWLSREDADFQDPPFLLPHNDITTTNTVYEIGSQEEVEGRRWRGRGGGQEVEGRRRGKIDLGTQQ